MTTQSVGLLLILLAIVTFVVPVVLARYRVLSYWWAIAAVSAILAMGIATLDPVAHADDWFYMAIVPAFLCIWASIFDAGYLSRSSRVLDNEQSESLTKGTANRETFVEALEMLVGYSLSLPRGPERRSRALKLYSQELQWRAAEHARDSQINAVLAALIMMLRASDHALTQATFWSWLRSPEVRSSRRDHATISRNVEVLIGAYPIDPVSGYMKGQNYIAHMRYIDCIRSLLDASTTSAVRT